MKKLCIHALHAIYPYYVALTQGSWFRWVKKNDGIIVQCPSADNNIVMKVFKRQDGIRVKIIDVRGTCPLHKEGETFFFKKEGCF